MGEGVAQDRGSEKSTPATIAGQKSVSCKQTAKNIENRSDFANSFFLVVSLYIPIYQLQSNYPVIVGQT